MRRFLRGTPRETKLSRPLIQFPILSWSLSRHALQSGQHQEIHKEVCRIYFKPRRLQGRVSKLQQMLILGLFRRIVELTGEAKSRRRRNPAHPLARSENTDHPLRSASSPDKQTLLCFFGFAAFWLTCIFFIFLYVKHITCVRSFGPPELPHTSVSRDSYRIDGFR